MLVVVGGHSRKIGKTSAMVALVAATSEANWTALKISANRQHGSAGTPWSLTEEHDPAARGDSARFLRAGARRAYWLRAADAQLAGTLPALRSILNANANVIVESNRIVEYLRPDLFFVVLDPTVADFKDSTRRYLRRASAFLTVGGLAPETPWDGISAAALAGIPQFPIAPPEYASLEAAELIRTRLAAHPGLGRPIPVSPQSPAAS